jgi:PAS domain S-box-containing protein
MVGKVTAEDLRRVVERLNDGLMLFDRQGWLLYLNGEAERILGRPGSELIGKPLRETMPEVVSKMREGARERLLAGEEMLLVQSFFAQGRWFEILGRPLGGSFLVHFRDITERLQADAARRQSEERFRILVNGVADYAIFMLDPKGHIASWNAAAERISGYPAEEVLGKPLAFVFPPELVERGGPRRRLEETVRHGSFKAETRFFRRDGAPIILQSTYTCLFDELGAPSGFAIVFHDITEQRKMEEALRINEERLRLAIEAGAVGTWEEILGEGRLVANSQFFAICGLPPNRQPTYDEFLAIVHPDDRAQHAQNRRRVLDAAAGFEFQWEYRALRGTDKSLRWLEVHGRVIETPNGNRRVLGVLRDRTRYHEMEEFREQTNRRLQAANEEIAEAAARTREVIELSPDAFFLTDMDLRITEVNAAACKMLGYERNEVVGKKSFFDLVRPEDAGRLEQAKAEMAATGDVHRGDWVQVRKGGTTGVVEVTSNILPGGRLQAFARDITERKRAENIRQRLATIVQQSNDSIISQDLKGNILTWNRSAERLYGYSEAEALRMNIAATVPEGDSEMLAHLDAARHGRQAPPVEVKRRAKDGRILEVWWTAAPLFEDGQQVGIVTTARDITERKRLEHERQSHLDAMERFYRVSAVFLSEQPAGAVLHELLDTAIAISQADFGNIQILDPTSAHLKVAAQRDLPDWWLDYWAGSVAHSASGAALAARERIVVEDVTRSPIFVGTEALDAQLKAGIRAIQSTPLISRSGALIGMISTHWKAPHRVPEQTLGLLDLLARRAADLIERVQMEAALREAVQTRDRVLGIVAHDLRNPLTLIMMHSKLMHRPSSEPERRDQKSAEVIRRAATRMNRLIQDLLDVTRLQAGRLPVERRPLSPGALAAEAVDMEVTFAASSSLDLRLALARDLPEIWVDRDRLLQVFENLIGNAMKFTEPGGRITVGAEARDQEVVFWVKDTGIGISAEDLPHVFDRFWQAAADAGRPGAGLGLSITKGIVEAHGGRIWVESTADQGSNFYFSIPTARPEEDGSSERAARHLGGN